MHWALSGEETARLRRDLLAGVQGRVLEVGFGTGLNLPHYPETVEALTAVDRNAAMPRWAAQRAEAAPFPVDVQVADATCLPMDAGQFDAVVCTYTLCSVRDPAAALAEWRRVLKPGGTLRFLEHGRSREARVSRWQDRLNGLQRWIGDGCNLNRDIRELVGSAFGPPEVREFYMEKEPRITGYTYMGTAVHGA